MIVRNGELIVLDLVNGKEDKEHTLTFFVLFLQVVVICGDSS